MADGVVAGRGDGQRPGDAAFVSGSAEADGPQRANAMAPGSRRFLRWCFFWNCAVSITVVILCLSCWIIESMEVDAFNGLVDFAKRSHAFSMMLFASFTSLVFLRWLFVERRGTEAGQLGLQRTYLLGALVYWPLQLFGVAANGLLHG